MNRTRVWTLLGLALLGACGAPTPNQRAIEVLERARALHREAAARSAGGDLPGALRTLAEIPALPFPAGAPEAVDVAVDALAERSRLLLGAGRAAAAERAAREAIARAQGPSFFLGLAWLRLGDALRAAGRHREAVAALERSIAVNRAVMRRLRGSSR